MVKVKVTLEQTMMAQSRSRCIVLLLLLPRRWIELDICTTIRPLYPLARDPIPTSQEAGWVPQSAWMGE